MAAKWIGTKFKGVRYYEHPTRKHGVKKDRYLAIRYQIDGKRIEEGIGWTSERDPEDDQNWTEAKAALILELNTGKGKRRHASQKKERLKSSAKRRRKQRKNLPKRKPLLLIRYSPNDIHPLRSKTRQKGPGMRKAAFTNSGLNLSSAI